MVNVKATQKGVRVNVGTGLEYLDRAGVDRLMSQLNEAVTMIVSAEQRGKVKGLPES